MNKDLCTMDHTLKLFFLSSMPTTNHASFVLAHLPGVTTPHVLHATLIANFI